MKTFPDLVALMPRERLLQLLIPINESFSLVKFIKSSSEISLASILPMEKSCSSFSLYVILASSKRFFLALVHIQCLFLHLDGILRQCIDHDKTVALDQSPDSYSSQCSKSNCLNNKQVPELNSLVFIWQSNSMITKYFIC